MRSVLLLTVVVFTVLQIASPTRGESPSGSPRRVKVLFLGDNGHHVPLERIRQVYSILGQHGVDLTYTDRLTDLNSATLARFDVLALYANWGKIAPEQESAVVDFIESGHGFAVIHCGSFCFLNSPKLTAITGARFKSHKTGTFKETIVAPTHPIEAGLQPIESWDETYVHELHNEIGRTVLSYRIEGDHREPYTWVRTQGKGRVFYTAWGHDEKTWSNENFQALIERGIRWSAGDWAMNPQAPAPFEYSEADIAMYVPGKGSVGAPKGKMQHPLSAEESQKHLVVPPGFEAKLVAAEPKIVKPICFAFDERGRLWIAESVDYPNDLHPEPGTGNDRLVICESSKHDDVMDQFTVFADHLSIPTSITFANGGVIVGMAPDIVFLKDSKGTGHADVRQVLSHGWGMHDTHSGISNLRWGFDNYIYGVVGYSGFKGEINGQTFSFGMGAFRFKPDGSKFEYLGSTTNNTWGMGLTEDNNIFGSTANNNPSWALPIPNRYYEQVAEMHSGRLEMICDTPNFWPITEHVRQVDCFGAYTAGSGHEIYTARSFPKEYWNRIALVTEPTGHLVGQFEIVPKGAAYETRNLFNLCASSDEWTAPIAATVGPDGAVWVIDWYNFIVQHNPTPKGLTTGKGAAYETPLRDKTHGRIYRIIYNGAAPSKTYDLANASVPQLIEALHSDNLLWRMHAQRLLVEKQDKSAVEALLAIAADASVDEIGLNGPAINALWTLHGLGQFDGSNPRATAIAVAAMKHKSAGVRRAAIDVLPTSPAAVEAILSANILSDADAHVRKTAMLKLSEEPASLEAGQAIHASLAGNDAEDRVLADASAIAACQHSAGFLKALFAAHNANGKTTEATVAVAPTPVNLIPNPSFEEISGSRPAKWKLRNYHGPATHTIDQPGRTGLNSLKIESTDGSDTSLFVDIPVDPNSEYRLSGWIKTKDVKGAMGGLLNVHGTPFKTQAISGTSDWKRVEVLVETGRMTKLSINCLFGGWGSSTGVVWYDDIELVKLHGSSSGGGREGRVTDIVLSHYASRGPIDSIVATLSSLKHADANLSVGAMSALAANWPDHTTPKLADADVTELHAVMQALPPAARDRLLALAGRWDRRDLFPEQSAAVVKSLQDELNSEKADPSTRAEAARRLIAVADETVNVEMILKLLSPKTSPEVQLAAIEALGDSRQPKIATTIAGMWSQLTPAVQKSALNMMLQKSAWTDALLKGIDGGQISGKDLLPQQWQILTNNPDFALATKAKKLQKKTGGAPSADRAQIVKKLSHLADEPGDASRGKLVFEKNCMVCHTLGDKGGKVGPELTGVGVRPRADILLQILDPNRVVEGNYRQWIVKTKDDVIAGRIFAESRTNLEIMDATGQLHHILRDDIQMLKATDKGVMPEGLESIPEQDLRDLLEFLSLSKVKR